MEGDPELKGERNSYDFGARIYDPRIGRWLSMDKLKSKSPGLTPYRYAFNSPTTIVDPDGNWEKRITNYLDENGKVVFSIVTMVEKNVRTDNVEHYGLSRGTEGTVYYNGSLFDWVDYFDFTTTVNMQMVNGKFEQIGSESYEIHSNSVPKEFNRTIDGYPQVMELPQGRTYTFGVCIGGSYGGDGLFVSIDRAKHTLDISSALMDAIKIFAKDRNYSKYDWKGVYALDPKALYKLSKDLVDQRETIEKIEEELNKLHLHGEINKDMIDVIGDFKFKYDNKKHFYWWGEDKTTYSYYDEAESYSKKYYFIGKDNKFIYNYNEIIGVPEGYEIYENAGYWNIREKKK